MVYRMFENSASKTMKKSFALLAAGMVAAFSSTPASADLLIYEPFDYTAGSAIIGQTDAYTPGTANTWARAGTAGTASVHSVVTPFLTAPSGFPASVGNAGSLVGGATGSGDFTEYGRMSLGSEYGANSTLYYSLLLNVPSTSGMTVPNSNLNAANDGIVIFNNAAGAGARPTVFAGELTLRLGSVANTFNLGVRATTTANNTTSFTGNLTPGQTYLVVVEYASGAVAGTGGVNSLWINPSSATFGAALAPAADETTAGTFSATAANDHADSLILGAGVAANADPTQTLVDELRVGTTWADVTSVPEPSTLVLAGFGALSLLSWQRARRR
jgi:PEP-CTERM motif